MLNSKTFFSNPAISPGQVYCQVLKIFRAEWQTFVGLLLACVAPWGLFIPFKILMVVIWAGIFHDDQQQSVITGKDISTSLLFLCIWLFFAGLAILAISTLQGATIRAVAEIYTGKRPSWLACLKVGWKNMFKITCFGFLVVLACCTAFLPFVVGVLAAIYSNTSSSSPDYYCLFFFVYFMVIAIVGATMIAGPSMIVVEGKSVIEAMKSSWHLCKTDICFVYFFLLQTLANFIFRDLLGSLSSRSDPVAMATALGLYSLIVSFAMVPLTMM